MSVFRKLLQYLGVAKKPEPERRQTYNVASFDESGKRVTEFHFSRKVERPDEVDK
ncbi:hypothetical protein [Geobacter argillaceus]|uniref:Uncharacterized protein n=1 Tax=Geobacter argillaceus TaxID=345631 RepID=A0A562V6Z7_9BACT|nr:hypothetical protein [Geobacter argillaceus]TWJ13518.1 hypothetical protein JN12_03829 [Geobacter argillaceus]